MTGSSSWGSDVPISMPQPSGESVLVQMFGFGYTQYGLVHDLNSLDYMSARRPASPPDVDPASEILDDAELDDITHEGDFI
jgi:hypothetical protein